MLEVHHVHGPENEQDKPERHLHRILAPRPPHIELVHSKVLLPLPSQVCSQFWTHEPTPQRARPRPRHGARMSDEQALPLGPEDDQKRLAESSSSFVAPGGDEVGHDRKRKREEKKALKALKREMAAAKKASLPWKLPQPDKGAAEGATGQQGLGSEGAGGNESRRKIRRGWMTRLEEREGEKSIEHIDFSKDFVPQDKDLAAEAPHWDLLRRALRNLQNAAKEMATKPSWAWQVKDAAGKTETPGPVLASVLKEVSWQSLTPFQRELVSSVTSRAASRARVQASKHASGVVTHSPALWPGRVPAASVRSTFA